MVLPLHRVGKRMEKTTAADILSGIDDEGDDPFRPDPTAQGEKLLFAGNPGDQGNVRFPVGKKNQERPGGRIPRCLPADQVQSLEESGRQRGRPAGNEGTEPFPGKENAAGRREYGYRPAVVERDQRDPVATTVGNPEKREDGSLRGGDPGPAAHRFRAVQYENDQP